MHQIRLELAAVAGLTILAMSLQLPLWGWLVEDAAISFAYARSLAEGLGAVPAAGAERVEGYSNPLWVAILTGGIAIGADPFVAVRWLGLIGGVVAVPITYLWARWAAPPPSGLIAAVWVGCSAQHAIWSQSGLENPLYSVILAVGGYRLVVGGDREWMAPVAFLALAWTRPEGVATALVAGVIALLGARSWRGVGSRIGCWARWFAVPLLAYHALRFVYFAQLWPATFHAKLGNAAFDPLDWSDRGWRQLRQITSALWLAPWLVCIPFGTGGTSGRRGAVAAGIALALAVAMLPVGPGWVRALVLCAAFTAVPLLAVGVPERRGALVATAMLWCGLLFCLRSGGDWMKGYRFVSLLVVPGSVAIAAGVARLSQRAPRIGAPWGLGIVGLGIGAVAVPQAKMLWDYVGAPTTTPYDVAKRVQHYEYLARRLGIDRARVVDHDMGGLLWWGTETMSIRDSRGLVDLPFALNGRPADFVQHELFEVDLLRGEPFDLAHVHASTGQALKRLTSYRQGYVEIAGGYPRGRLDPHVGQAVRRDLFLRPPPGVPPIEIQFAGGSRLVGVRVPSPEIAPGSGVLVEIDLAASRDLRMIAFLASGTRVIAAYELAPGYDWIAPHAWRGDAFHGRFALRIPPDAPHGAYDLGFVVLTADGVAPAIEAVGAVLPDAPAYALGEVRLEDRVLLVDRDRMFAEARADLNDVAELALDGRCEAAEVAWGRAAAHRIRSRDWRAGHRPAVARQIAACWATAAAGPRDGDALEDRVEDLRRGRSWDPRSEAVAVAVGKVATTAWERGLAARRRSDRAEAFRWFTAAVHADPDFVWARRYAEQARPGASDG